MADRITHVVEYAYWFRDYDGWDFRDYHCNCVNEAQAMLVADRLRRDANVVDGSVEIKALAEPFMASSEYEE